jgi:hypothetical protein
MWFRDMGCYMVGEGIQILYIIFIGSVSVREDDHLAATACQVFENSIGTEKSDPSDPVEFCKIR